MWRERCTVMIYMYIHVLMRDEKEERKKQARSNKQTQHVHVYTCTCNPLPQFSRLGIQVSLAIYVYLSGLWLGGLLHLSFLSDLSFLIWASCVQWCLQVSEHWVAVCSMVSAGIRALSCSMFNGVCRYQSIELQHVQWCLQVSEHWVAACSMVSAGIRALSCSMFNGVCRYQSIELQHVPERAVSVFQFHWLEEEIKPIPFLKLASFRALASSTFSGSSTVHRSEIQNLWCLCTCKINVCVSVSVSPCSYPVCLFPRYNKVILLLKHLCLFYLFNLCSIIMFIFICVFTKFLCINYHTDPVCIASYYHATVMYNMPIMIWPL